MNPPYLGEIRIFSFSFAPKGWALCNGQLLSINQNNALFSLFLTTYGGDGQNTFALPDLRGRVPKHFGSTTVGQRGGEESHTLTLAEMPGHSHTVNASVVTANQKSPAGNSWAPGSSAPGYYPTADAYMNQGVIVTTGSSSSHENRSPYLVLNCSIALQGIFPSRN